MCLVIHLSAVSACIPNVSHRLSGIVNRDMFVDDVFEHRAGGQWR